MDSVGAAVLHDLMHFIALGIHIISFIYVYVWMDVWIIIHYNIP